MGYSLPNTIPTPSDTASWPGLRVQPRLVDTRRPKALAAKATPWSRPCCTRLWGFWDGALLPRLSHSLWVLLALLPWDSCLSFHGFSRPQHPGPADQQSQEENPS